MLLAAAELQCVERVDPTGNNSDAGDDDLASGGEQNLK